MKIVILFFLSLILQDIQKPNTEQIGNPRGGVTAEKPEGRGQDDDRDPEDVKFEHELWKKILGENWRVENDPSKLPKFVRARMINTEPSRKDMWQVEAVYTINDNDGCRRVAAETVSTYGGALEDVQVTSDYHSCYFFIRTNQTSAEAMSHDKKIRRVREVDDTWPPPGRSFRSLIQLQPLPLGKSQPDPEGKPKPKQP